MPVLFGTDYLLPAIIVVVLLVALLVLLASRRRGAALKAKGSDKTKAAGEPMAAAAVAAGGSSGISPGEAVAAAAVEPPSQLAAVAGPVAAPSRGRRSRATGADSADPLHLVLMDLLGGWGDLTTEDTRRLEIFRPEKVVAAIAAIELPKSKTSDDARNRLAQLRLYADDLERRQKSPQAPASPVETTAAPTETPTPLVPAPGGAAPASGAAAPAVAAATVPKTAGPEATWYAPPAAETSAAVPAAAVPAAAVPAAAVPAAAVPAAAAATVAASAAAAEQAPPRKDLGAVASFWAEPEPEHRPVQAPVDVVFEETVPPAYDEIAPRIEAEVVPEASGAAEVAPAPVFPAAEALAGAMSEELDPLSRLRVRIQNAADLLALPPEEQAEMVAFLEPHDLSAVFRATRNTQVKLAVIDTLANIGSPASLSALGSCLDDPDRDIQLYALDAADRLLRTND